MAQSPEPKVRIVDYPNARISNPYVVVGLPEAGLVGSIASSYLAKLLNLPEIGYVESELEPPVVVIENSVPRYPIRIFGKDNLVVFVCDIPLTPKLATEFAKAVVNWSMAKHSRLIIGATGLPSRDRLEQKDELPGVFYAATAQMENFASILNKAQALEEAIVIGTYALILRICRTTGQPNITFFAESHFDFPDPGAAAAVINVLKILLNIEVDVKPLLEESEQIRVKTRDLMKRTQQSMQQMSKGAPELYA